MMTTKRLTAAALFALLPFGAAAQTVLDSPELYAGEKVLYEEALKEGMAVSFDTGPTWANWAAEFKAFTSRYPGLQLVYNDLAFLPPGASRLMMWYKSP